MVGLTEFLFRALGSAWLLLTAIHSRAFRGLDRVSLQPQEVAANGWQSEQNGVGEANHSKPVPWFLTTRTTVYHCFPCNACVSLSFLLWSLVEVSETLGHNICYEGSRLTRAVGCCWCFAEVIRQLGRNWPCNQCLTKKNHCPALEHNWCLQDAGDEFCRRVLYQYACNGEWCCSLC